MGSRSSGKRFRARTWLGGAALAVAPGFIYAQTPPAGNAITEVVVTGSRIPQTDPAGPSPTTVIDSRVIEDRGFVQVGQALNENTSITPSIPISEGSGGSAGGGEQLPQLFGLG